MALIRRKKMTRIFSSRTAAAVDILSSRLTTGVDIFSRWSEGAVDSLSSRSAAAVDILASRTAACVIILAVFALVTGAISAFAAEEAGEPAGAGASSGTESRKIRLLELSSIGHPTALKQEAARNITDLQVFRDRLYIGHGDAMVNTGPTDIIWYDFAAGEFETNFTVDDEAIYRYRILDGTLAIPGPDATEDWDYGNVYVLEDLGWVKRRTVQHGIHVNDLASGDGAWYATTGSYFDLDDDSMYPLGAIMRSTDRGATWALDYATRCDGRHVYRVDGLADFGGSLFAFPYAFSEVKVSDIPEENRPPGVAEDAKVLLFADDPFGPFDTLVNRGDGWRFTDLLPVEHVCRVTPVVFGNRLVMAVRHGAYVPYARKTAGTLGLFVHDGASVRELDPGTGIDSVRDILVRDGALLLLAIHEGRSVIAETTDLETWTLHRIPSGVTDPVSIERHEGTFYIGTNNGNIFAAAGFAEFEDEPGIVRAEPVRFHGAARLPREGLCYWSAVTGWGEWGRHAGLTCAVSRGNRLTVETDNAASFLLFLPLGWLDPEMPATLTVNGVTVFEGAFTDCSALSCSLGAGGEWRVKKSTETPETFKYERRIAATALTDLSTSGPEPVVGRWKADVFRWSSGADIALVLSGGMRKGLPKGDIALEDLVDANYPNTICTFSGTGEEVRRMLEWSHGRKPWERCLVSGFQATITSGGEKGAEPQVSVSLDGSRSYRIAVSSYLASRAEELFGLPIEFEDTGVSVVDAMAGWLAHHGTVEEPAGRLTFEKTE